MARPRLTTLAAAAGLVLTLGSACDTGGAGRVEGARAKQMVAAGAVLVDVRTEGEYESRHLPGALLIPVSQVGERLEELPRDEPIIVYCQSGVRSARAAETLRGEGFEVHDLGGIGAWPD